MRAPSENLSFNDEAFRWNGMTNKGISINPVGALLGPKTMVSATHTYKYQLESTK